MSRYRAMFSRLNERREIALGAFLMLGDPDLETSASLLSTMIDAGADMLEVGIPFSDPVADGPVIQAAARRALQGGTRVADAFRLIERIRQAHPEVPIGILTYANLATAPGRTEFFRRAAASGADSLLIADLPADEAEPWAEEMKAAQIEPVLIAAGNTPRATLERIATLSRAYTYCVTRAGVTGAAGEVSFDGRLVERLRTAGASAPIFGFGISRPEHVRAAADAGAAGVISGSAIVDCASRGGDVAALIRSLKDATRNESASR